MTTVAPDRFQLPVTVRFGDTDPYGVVYFASYFRYCHHGIEEFLKHYGLVPDQVFRNRDKGFGLPVVQAECKFLKPIRYPEELRLIVFILRIKDKTITFGFQFYREGGDELIAEGEATLVAIDTSWHARPLPDSIRKALSPPE